MVNPDILTKGIEAIEIFADIKESDWETLDMLAVHMAALIFKAGLSSDDYYHPLLNEMRKIRRQFGK